MSRRKPRPTGNVQVFCTGRGAHERVDLCPPLQLVRAGDRVRVLWNHQRGPAPVTGYRDADGWQTLIFDCPQCARTPKWHEPRFIEMTRVLAVHQGLEGNDKSPIEMDISTVERA